MDGTVPYVRDGDGAVGSVGDADGVETVMATTVGAAVEALASRAVDCAVVTD